MKCAGPLALLFVTLFHFSQRSRLDEAAAGKKKKGVVLRRPSQRTKKSGPLAARSILTLFPKETAPVPALPGSC
jgi:hypothetical protein